jgi:hypothetical protein
MSLHEVLAMVVDAYESGLVDRVGAMDALMEATGMSAGLCAQMLADEVVDRRWEAKLRAMSAEWRPRHDDGRWR